MIQAGTIVVLTEKGAKEVMTRWHSRHPFHELAKWLTEHSDAKLLIKKKEEQYCEITLEPETFQKYEVEIREKHLSIHLANWEEHWFKPVGQLQLPKPKYQIGEEVFVKDCGKYHKTTIEKIEPIWHIESYFSPCTFKTWGYHVVGHGVYPFPEEKIVPTFKHEKTSVKALPIKEIGFLTEEEQKPILKKINEKSPANYGDWYVYYCATEKYWFLRNETTLEDHPKRFDHPPTLEEIKTAVEEREEQKPTVLPPIVLKPEDNFDDVLRKLYSKGWRVNSAEYMQADTVEKAVELQAKTFPSLEFQPVKMPNGKWVAFHRKPQTVAKIEKKLNKQMKETIEKQRIPNETETEPKKTYSLLMQKSIFDYIKQNKKQVN